MSDQAPTTAAFDGSRVPAWVTTPCGNTAHFNHESGYGYICEQCFAVLGSVGMPSECNRAERDLTQ